MLNTVGWKKNQHLYTKVLVHDVLVGVYVLGCVYTAYPVYVSLCCRGASRWPQKVVAILGKCFHAWDSETQQWLPVVSHKLCAGPFLRMVAMLLAI